MATYYVAPYGDDANTGTSPSAPFKTINKAAQVMVNGDVCYVAPGVYRETVNLPSVNGTLTFVGDRKAEKFPGVAAGAVVVDGTDDGSTPVRQYGVAWPESGSQPAVLWSNIDIRGVSVNAFSVRGNLDIEACNVQSSSVAINGLAAVKVSIRNATIRTDTGVAIAPTIGSLINIEDCVFYSSGVVRSVGQNNSTLRDAVIAKRVLHIAPDSYSGYSFNVGNSYYLLEDIVCINSGLSSVQVWVDATPDEAYPGQSLARRVTVVKPNFAVEASGVRWLVYGSNYAAASVDNVVHNAVICEAKSRVGTAASYGQNRLYGSALLDNASISGVSFYYSIPTIQDANGNELLPDFTPVGAQLLRAEEENPIEGLRSARIDVPRVAYYPFKVAVSGANTITLKARKSHPTGTTVKFRVDKDPAKVVTLADTDEVQTIQLGPVEDRGPRFVELEFWAQQVDYIPGHYVLIDSIQVV